MVLKIKVTSVRNILVVLASLTLLSVSVLLLSNRAEAEGGPSGCRTDCVRTCLETPGETEQTCSETCSASFQTCETDYVEDNKVDVYGSCLTNFSVDLAACYDRNTSGAVGATANDKIDSINALCSQDIDVMDQAYAWEYCVSEIDETFDVCIDDWISNYIYDDTSTVQEVMAQAYAACDITTLRSGVYDQCYINHPDNQWGCEDSTCIESNEYTFCRDNEDYSFCDEEGDPEACAVEYCTDMAEAMAIDIADTCQGEADAYTVDSGTEICGGFGAGEVGGDRCQRICSDRSLPYCTAACQTSGLLDTTTYTIPADEDVCRLDTDNLCEAQCTDRTLSADCPAFCSALDVYDASYALCKTAQGTGCLWNGTVDSCVDVAVQDNSVNEYTAKAMCNLGTEDACGFACTSLGVGAPACENSCFELPLYSADSVSPTMIIDAVTSPVDPGVGGTYTFTGTASDITSVKAVQFRLVKDAIASEFYDCTVESSYLNINLPDFTCSFDDSIFTAGSTVTVEMKATDYYDQASTEPYSTHFDIVVNGAGESDAPVITLNPLAVAYNLNTTRPTFTGNISDETAVASARYKFNFEDESSWRDFTPTDGTWDETSEDFTIETPIDLNDGGFITLVIRSCDTLANCSRVDGPSSDHFEASYRFSINAKDTTAPEVVLNPVLPHNTSDRTPQVHGYARDNTVDKTSAIESVSYQIDGAGSWIPVSAFDGAYDSPQEEFFIQLPELALGSHSVEVVAKDASPDAENFSTGTTVDFVIVERPTGIEAEIITKTESFDTYEYYDANASTGVWGDGEIKLTQEMDYGDPVNELWINGDQMGYKYGTARVNIQKEKTGNNLWLFFDDGSLGYFNVVSKSLTDYGKPRGGSQIASISEFSYGDSEYFAIGYFGGVSAGIYETHGTMDNTADDSYVDYDTDVSNNIAFQPYGVDMRSGDPALIVLTPQGGIYGAPDGVAARVDLNGTVMDVSDDIFTTWTLADGITDTNITALYFDESTNRTLLGYYGNSVDPSFNVAVCDDKGTLDTEADDTCTDIHAAVSVFSIIKDRFGGYIVGGDTLARVEITDLEAPDIDDRATVTQIMELSDFIFSEGIKRVQYIERTAPEGDEIVVTGREGNIYRVMYNNTSTKVDDRIFTYQLSTELYTSYVGFDSELSDPENMWIFKQNVGLFRVPYDLIYEESNVIEILATAPLGKQEINHITLTSVVGDYTDEMVDFYVSNNNGITWLPIEIAQTITFPTSDYLLKVRIVMHRGSTPVIEAINLSYAEYPDDSAINSTLNFDYPPQINEGIVFDAGIDFVDDLGLTPHWNGTVYLDVLPRESGSVKGCVQYPSSVSVVNGMAVFNPRALCEGTFAFVGWTDDGHIGTGINFSILGINDGGVITIPVDEATTTEPFCGNGVIDEGEQCDSSVGVELACGDFGDFTGGVLRCSSTCQIDTAMCTSTSTTQAVCGNGRIDPGEQCDGADIRMQCRDFDGYNGGTISCNDTCQINMRQCTYGVDILEVVADTFDNTGGQVATAMIPILTILSSIILLNITGFQLYSGTISLWFNLLAWLGIRKKGQPYGVVYNSITKEPVNGAIVRIFKPDGRLVQTQVTDVYGIFNASLEKGRYIIKVQLSGFTFPSEVIMAETDYQYQNIYTGDMFENLNRGEIVMSIPLDPVSRRMIQTARAILLNQLSSIVKFSQVLFFVIALFISIVVFAYNRNLVNTLILLLYVPSLIALIVTILTPVMKLGRVVDAVTLKPKTNLPLELKEIQFERVIASRITDPDGLYRFIVHPGEYSLNTGVQNVEIDNRKQEKLDKIVVETKPSVIAFNIKAKSKE